MENLTPELPSGYYHPLGFTLDDNIQGSKGRTHKKRVTRLNKKILTLCFFVFLFPSLISYSEDKSEISYSKEDEKSDTLKICDRWLAWDKVKHFGVSAYFSAISYKIFRDFYHNRKESSLYFSGGFTFSLGLGKEVYDETKPKGKFSYKDLAADILGIGLGLWIATR